MTRAIVVFTGNSEHPLSRFLKDGFHHVYCVVENDGNWLLFDPRDGKPEIKYLTRLDGFDLAQHYRNHGLTVIEIDSVLHNKSSLLPFAHRNCVGLVKHVLSLRCWAVTPWQLYRYLTRRHKQ